MNNKKVVVIGGGISGLATAFWLHRNGVEVTVLEQNNHVGGTICTEITDGFLVEYGPNSTLETTPLISKLLEETEIKGEMCYANEVSNKRYILRNGRLCQLPMSPPAFIKTKLFSTRAKLRLLAEPFIGRSSDGDESVADFVVRRLGQEFLDYAINPFVAGVYAGSPEQLSVRSAFPKLYALEENYGSLIKGTIKGHRERKKRAEVSKQFAKMFSFKLGMETMPRAIARKLGDKVMLNTQVQGLRIKDSRFRYSVEAKQSGKLQTFEAEVVILATPAYRTAQIVESFVKETASCYAGLREIYYPPVAVVFTAYKSERIKQELDGFGFLVPEKEKRNILGTIWSSTIFPNRAPEGYAGLTTFVGGTRQAELVEKDDDELLRLVQQDLATIMGIEGKPDFIRIIRWERAIPQYNIGYSRVMESIERLERQFPGLYVCSNYRGGISVGDCIMNADRTVQRVLEYIDSMNCHTST